MPRSLNASVHCDHSRSVKPTGQHGCSMERDLAWRHCALFHKLEILPWRDSEYCCLFEALPDGSLPIKPEQYPDPQRFIAWLSLLWSIQCHPEGHRFRI